jgi:hypothetical protein
MKLKPYSYPIYCHIDKCCVCSSMSLSSLDSEQDDPFLDQVNSAGSTRLLVTSPAGSRRATRATGGASTHSLNEADLQVY